MADTDVPRHLRLVTDTPAAKVPKRSSLRLTDDQRASLYRALQGLRRKFGTWDRLAAEMGMCTSALVKVPQRRCGSFAMAVQAARVAGVPVELLLSGGVRDAADCPTCGQRLAGK
jgi:CelD/BcsL family acetyltransferase involved in cellulose biosynthesis